jgi:hypothetical protein
MTSGILRSPSRKPPPSFKYTTFFYEQGYCLLLLDNAQLASHEEFMSSFHRYQKYILF